MGLTIAYGAYGSAITFNKDKLKRSNGSYEYYNFLKYLCAVPNIESIYLLSTSDYEKTSLTELKEIDPNNKIKLVWKKDTVRPSGIFKSLLNLNGKETTEEIADIIKKHPDYNCVGEVQAAGISQIHDALKDVKIDQIFLYLSQGVSNWNVPNAKKTRFGYGNQCLEMSHNYTSPVTYFLNARQEVPWYILMPDPRWGGKEKFGIMIDNFKVADAVMTQYDLTTEWRHVTEYDPTKLTTEFNYKYETVNFKYKQIEKVTSIQKTPKDPSNDRNIMFCVAAMQATPEHKWKDDYRFKELEKWILSNDKNDYRIYGKWAAAVKDKYNSFKGEISPYKLDETFENTRYTLIIPIEKNWVTGKYVEMLMCGVLPFFHPDYDTQHHILPADHILRIKSPAALKSAIDFFERHPEERIKLVKQLQDSLLANITDGSFLSDVINQTNEELNIPIRFDKPIFKKKKNKMMKLFS